MPNDYEDIIDLPHHTSKNHPRMPLEARAAQFAPFAALNGHSAAIAKTADEAARTAAEHDAFVEFED